MRAFWFTVGILFVIGMTPAKAETYIYHAVCPHSYSKQGAQQDDLTKQPGKPITCNGVVLSIFANGNVLVQFADKGDAQGVIGFAGDGLDYKANPNFITLPLQRLHLPRLDNPAKPEVVDGIDGYCFLSGGANPRALNEISCVAKVEMGQQRIVYKVDAKISGIGELVQ